MMETTTLTFKDYVDVLYQHFLKMRDCLMSGDEQMAGLYAEQWQRVWMEHLDQEQRKAMYEAYQHTIEVQIPDELKWRAYGLMALKPELVDPVENLAKLFNVELPPTNGRDIGTQPDSSAILDALSRNEAGDASLLAHLYAGRIVYDHAENRWYIWAGQYWQADACKRVINLVSGPLAGTYLEEAARQRAAGEVDISDRLVKRAGALRYKNRINNVLTLAASHPNLALKGSEWDRDPWLLACVNGVLDLRTGDIRPGQPVDYMRAACPTSWEGLDARADRWEQFLDEIFDEDAELIAFVKRLVGYALTGLSVEHVLPVAWGNDGRNGKDTLFSTLKHILGGELSGPVETSILLDRSSNAENATPALYELRFKRMVWCSEINQGMRLNPGRVKLLTGGGQFQARPLYGRPVTITPRYLVFLMTNYKPHAPADDEALWDRLLLIPFGQRFIDEPSKENEHKRDPHLMKKLIAEGPGILASLVLGCLDWQANGLKPPAIVKVATAQYRKDEDDLTQFLDECCVVRPDVQVKASAFYGAYRIWAEEHGIKPMSHTALGKRLTKRDFDKARLETGIWYIGVGLLG